MPVEFIRKEVSVTLGEGEERLPQRFRLAGKDYEVAEVMAAWQDHGYSGLPQTRRGGGGRGWRGGSQRHFYRLRTAEGETFEIYAETPAGRRGAAGKPRWFAHRRITGGAVVGEAPAQEEAPAEPPAGSSQAE